MANDDVYRTFLTYIEGLITKEETIKRLKIKKLFNQFVFATQKALDRLKFINGEVVK